LCCSSDYRSGNHRLAAVAPRSGVVELVRACTSRVVIDAGYTTTLRYACDDNSRDGSRIRRRGEGLLLMVALPD